MPCTAFDVSALSVSWRVLQVILTAAIKKSIFVEAFVLMSYSLIKYFNRYATLPLNQSEIGSIESMFVPKKFRKRQYFLQEGEVCKYTAFIIRRATRQYSVDDTGEEHIIRSYIDNWWATDRESLMKQTPSIYLSMRGNTLKFCLLRRPPYDIMIKQNRKWRFAERKLKVTRIENR